MSQVTIETMPRDSAGRVAPTKNQMKLLRLIAKMSRANGYPPTIRELESALDCKSPNAIHQSLRYLRRKGWVEWQPYRSRTLRVTGPVS